MFKSEQHVEDRVESLRALLPPLRGFTETDVNKVSQLKAEQVVDTFRKTMEGVLNAHTIEHGQIQSRIWNPKALTETRKQLVSTLHSQDLYFDLI